MPRKKIPQSIQTEILVRSRRRCCICYGLHRDLALKKGQIVHLNGDPSNNALSNLAYICLEHHAELDTTTCQSKGLTTHEVKIYQMELYDNFSNWSFPTTRAELIRNLISQIGSEYVDNAAVSVISAIIISSTK